MAKIKVIGFGGVDHRRQGVDRKIKDGVEKLFSKIGLYYIDAKGIEWCRLSEFRDSDACVAVGLREIRDNDHGDLRRIMSQVTLLGVVVVTSGGAEHFTMPEIQRMLGNHNTGSKRKVTGFIRNSAGIDTPTYDDEW